MVRPPRLAFAVLPGLDHFIPDLVPALNATGAVDARVFRMAGSAGLAAGMAEMLRWTGDGDAIWFEFCWPPFPSVLASTDFGGRRVVVRVHRIEAYGTDHVGKTDWSHVTDVVVVGQDMAARTRAAAPEIGLAQRLHVIHNGLDLGCFKPGDASDAHRIGWCGAFSLHKNPLQALEILHRLHRRDMRYRLHIASKGGDPVALDAFGLLSRRLGLADAIVFDGGMSAGGEIAAWHRRNGVLLSTSVYESFGYAIAEAAACGCDIAVLDNAAAGEFWPAECLFASAEEAADIIFSARPNRWRGLVEARFDVKRQARDILGMLGLRSSSLLPLREGPEGKSPPHESATHPGPPIRPSPEGEAVSFSSTQAGLREGAARPRPEIFNSAAYWERRYQRGGTSGAGSVGRLARFKADVVNRIVAEHGIGSVIEFGCGDGDQLALAEYPDYAGVDVSGAALALCRQKFSADSSKRFYAPAEAIGLRADLALSLDVLYHLVEDRVFESYMAGLFAAARRLVVIYSSNRDDGTRDAHVRHRAFHSWVSANAPEWRLSAEIPNPYPFDPARPNDTSFAHFHLFEQVAGGRQVERIAAGRQVARIAAGRQASDGS